MFIRRENHGRRGGLLQTKHISFKDPYNENKGIWDRRLCRIEIFGAFSARAIKHTARTTVVTS